MLLKIHEPGATPSPHEEAGGRAVGIDLGTTHSLVAVAEGGKAHAFCDDEGRVLIPSVVAFASGGALSDAVVGYEALALLAVAPRRVVSSIKRLMGRGVEDVAKLGGGRPLTLVESGGGMARLEVMGRVVTPVEISSLILGAARERAEKALASRVDKAVVTVPAYFDDAARSATRDAARLAGLSVLRLVNEPTAAALAYGLESGKEGIYAVYDLGGGTFDISLLHLRKGVFQVLATGGDSALGGDDFDHAVAEALVADAALLREMKDGALSVEDVKRLLAEARIVREALSRESAYSGEVGVSAGRVAYRMERSRLEALLRPYVERTLRLCRGVLSDAGVAPGDVAGVVLAGGATRTPLVRREVERYFEKEPLGGVDPDRVVALGAALQAEALTAGSGNLLLDVLPLSLGLETMGGLSEKVIERNTPIPVAKAQRFTTWQDGQSAMSIHVVQGEREMVADNRSLARFTLSGIPPMVAGAARVKVMFTVDADGLLTVAAREETSGREQRVEVKPSYGLSEEEMVSMLRESHVQAQEDMAARLLAEVRVDGRRLLAAVDSALAASPELCTEGERRAISEAREVLRRALKGDERALISRASEALEAAGESFAARRMDAAVRGALAGRTIEEAAALRRR